jgi:hypothetical protein
VATGTEPSFRSLNAVVVNRGDDQNTFRLDPLTCAVRRHDQIYPFDIGENPDLIYGFDCKVVPGNSGGPLFASGDTVQGVLQATVDPAKKIAEGAAESLRHWIGIATNLRCFPLVGNAASSCVAVTVDTINQRAAVVADVSWQKITRLGDARRSAFPTEMNVVRLRLKEKINGFEAIETVDEPTCIRPGTEELSELKFLSELVVLERDEWGQPRNVVTDQRVSVGRVTSRYKDFYQIEIQWQPPFGPLETPEQHASVRLGPRFKIELPRCAR